ncbi:helix-turn-helix transcriptional regulator [Ammoniphilus sp. 3BR4]|uniref:helix-turn-helix transcriptional regulator n=1 Tax=Ammoniphilus sp. 3BR4 TaxID=3158265 RepID=UPI0034653EEA
MNTFVLKKDGSILLAFERNPLPEFMKEIQHKDFSILWMETLQHADSCCLYTNAFGLSYLASLVKIEGEKTELFVMGPFLKKTPDTNKLRTAIDIDQKKQIILEEFLRGLKLMGSSKIRSLANILYNNSGLFQHAPLHAVNEQPETFHARKVPSIHHALQQPDEEYVDLIELRYQLQKELMHAVERGDKDKVQETFLKSIDLFDFSERLPNQPIRIMKNAAIVLNTLLRIAAENGKVQPFFLHHLSEKFAIHIERVESLESLNKLIETMCYEYCDLVKNHSIVDYSPLIQKAVSFLTVRFSHPFNLKDLAQHCLVHPAHLSRQFKKETGMTITDFLHKLRIEEAKTMLKMERTPIDIIAGNVGFDDAGYFTRVFKKWEGMTPTKYRNSN